MRALFSLSGLGPRRLREKHVSVKSTVTGCDVTNSATTLQGFNKHFSKDMYRPLIVQSYKGLLSLLSYLHGARCQWTLTQDNLRNDESACRLLRTL